MPIRRSSAADVGRLIAELSSDDALQRETASARLAVIGARAVTGLSALAGNLAAPAHARIAALQALESIGDPRALDPALALAADSSEVGLAAIAVLGAVARTRDARATRAFDWLTSVTLDPTAGEARRLAALTALEGVAVRHLKPVYEALARDRSPAIAARASRRAAGQTLRLDRANERGLPDDPALVSAMIRDEAEGTNVTVLRRLIDAIRERERRAPVGLQAAWTAARGQVHQSLAGRQSRLGIFDLRETLEHATSPLPVGFLAAAAAVGDATCLEPLAAAWLAADPRRAAAAQRWWRDHLADAFRAIVRRETLTRRHPVLKRILARHPAAAVLVAEARRT